MNVTQAAQLTNKITSEVLGESAVVNEDLSNIVDIGKQIADARGLDNFVKALPDQVGKMIFVDRPYHGRMPAIVIDDWAFGSMLQKISVELPEAFENESWELNDGASYDPNIFYKPKARYKVFNSKVTWEVPLSVTEAQVRSSFTSAQQMGSFLSMVYNYMSSSMELRTEKVVQRAVNNMIAETLTGLDLTTSNIRAVNLLAEYNKDKAAANKLTKSNCWQSLDFLVFCAQVMQRYVGYLADYSTLFNKNGTQKHTPREDLHCVFLNDFLNTMYTKLQSNTFHNEYTALPMGDSVSYWQGSGTDYAFNSLSKIDVKTANNNVVSATGIVGIMFDRNAVAVCNQRPRVLTHYNAKAEFWNYFNKWDAMYINDLDENFVVFHVN